MQSIIQTPGASEPKASRVYEIVKQVAPGWQAPADGSRSRKRRPSMCNRKQPGIKIRILLILYAENPIYIMELWDIKQAFVSALIDMLLYIRQPFGHIDPKLPDWVLDGQLTP